MRVLSELKCFSGKASQVQPLMMPWCGPAGQPAHLSLQLQEGGGQEGDAK
jgi:hypothetical protein